MVKTDCCGSHLSDDLKNTKCEKCPEIYINKRKQLLYTLQAHDCVAAYEGQRSRLQSAFISATAI